MSDRTDDLIRQAGETLIRHIESGEVGKWGKPWQSAYSALGEPSNAVTGKAYQGINTLVLWSTAAERDYSSNLWGTYRQWQKKDAQVSKGEKGTHAVKWGVTYTCQTCKAKGRNACSKPGHESRRHFYASSFVLFNLTQTEGYEPPVIDLGPEPERLANVETFIEAVGADVRHIAGDKAFFVPGSNSITLPLREQFETPQGYYGTVLHELTHWSGDASRLDRENRNTFGSRLYAAEELVAEFGSAMLAAHFGIVAEPSMNQAAYLKSWVEVIRSEPMALYRAMKLATEATAYLLKLAEASEATVAA